MSNVNDPSKRRPMLAMLVDYYGGEYQMGLIAAAQRAIRRMGCDLCVFVGRSIDAPEAASLVQNDIYRHVDASMFDGVVVGSGCIGIYARPERLAEFCRHYGTLPLCSISTQLPSIPSLVVSNRRGMQLPVDHLIEEHRCQRIAYIRGPLASEEAEERFDGYRESLKSHGVAFDARLIEVGNFWITSGAEAMQRLLDRGAAFDAVVAANDYMALGAMSVLRANGIRVPHAVRVAGFDDVQSAIMASPSLTTVRQPLGTLGELAVEFIRDKMQGNDLPMRHELDVELVPRQSCGCGYRVRPLHSSVSFNPLTQPVLVELTQNRRNLIRRLVKCAEIPTGSLAGWAERVLSALTEELQGRVGRFLLELEDLLDEAQPNSLLIERFYSVILILRTELAGLSTLGCAIEVLDDIWHASLLLVSDATRRSHLSAKHESDNAQYAIRGSVERISTALSHTALADALREVFEMTKIPSAAISLYANPERTRLTPLIVHGRIVPGDAVDSEFATTSLAPPGFFDVETPCSYVAMPITFGTEHLGLALFEGGAHHSIYTMLREQIGATLKGASLHRSVVHQTALRERAEREQLQKETAIAQQIQTAILPAHPEVPGFEIAARMLPAASVGGDYYDVIPCVDGAWIGFGDVTGHGLLSGLIMLMIQSMVASAVANTPAASPSHIVKSINRALFNNIRDRLDRDEHATFTLIRYLAGGRLVAAGVHEVVLILRAKTGRCEQVTVPGFWLGAVADVGAMTEDVTLQLDPGDLLVLFSDGITESMNSAKKLFGLENLMHTLEKLQRHSPSAICDKVLETASEWGMERLDDMTLLVARYMGDSPPHQTARLG